MRRQSVPGSFLKKSLGTRLSITIDITYGIGSMVDALPLTSHDDYTSVYFPQNGESLIAQPIIYQDSPFTRSYLVGYVPLV